MAGSKGIVSNQFYKFSAANQTITFSNDYAGLDLGEIAYITNIKNGVATVIYDPFDATKGGTLNGLTLTLAYNTTTMADSDPLQVIVGFTPLNADPLPVTIVEGADQKDDTELLNRIADSIDFLNLALDQSEGIEINTRDKSIKKDSQGAIVQSDVVEIQGPVLKAATETFIVDTTGYNSVIYNISPSTVSANLIAEASNDGNTWFVIPYVYAVSNATAPTYTAPNGSFTISSNLGYTIICQSIGRFIRIRISSYTSGGIRPTAILKNIVANPVGVLVSTSNIAQFNGTTIVASTGGSNITPAGGVSTAGALSVGGAYAPTHNPPNAATTLATNIPYPIGTAGREQPYVGALSGVFRYITVDGGGRYILGGDSPDTETKTLSKLASGAIPGLPPRGVGAISNNMRGAQSLTVADTNQDFGDTQVSLLRQILTELKILNQNFAEMPQMLNNPSYELSEPQEYRDNGAFDSPLQ